MKTKKQLIRDEIVEVYNKSEKRWETAYFFKYNHDADYNYNNVNVYNQITKRCANYPKFRLMKKYKKGYKELFIRFSKKSNNIPSNFLHFQIKVEEEQITFENKNIQIIEYKIMNEINKNDINNLNDNKHIENYWIKVGC